MTHMVGVRQRQLDERRKPKHYSRTVGQQLALFEDTWLWSVWQSLCDDCGVLAEHPTRAGAESTAMMHYRLGNG